MLVYRVEDIDGAGPYQRGHNNLLGKFGWGMHSNSSTHPTPCQDGIEMGRGDVFCGFVSFESVFDWFEEDKIEWFKENGFFLASYEIDPLHVQVGRRTSKQIGFVREHGVLVERIEF